MKYSRFGSLAALFVFFAMMNLSQPSASAGSVSARSPQFNDVAVAINIAANGDTVNVPAGAATWNQAVPISKSIQLVGAGADKTTIVKSGNGGAFAITNNQATNSGKPTIRISGFTITGNPGANASIGGGAIEVNGTTQALRIDHIHFKYPFPNYWTIVFYGNIYGVVDHCLFDSGLANESLIVNHPAWGGNANGDGSWADSAYWATGKAVYVEDCIFNLQPFSVDTLHGGGRYVLRHSTLSADCSNHGTETGGRLRAGRTMEVYNNRFTRPSYLAPWYSGLEWRGGALTSFNNYWTNFNTAMTANVYRLIFIAPYWGGGTWGGADGYNPWDLNAIGKVYNGITPTKPAGEPPESGSVYASGTYNGAKIDPAVGDPLRITLNGLRAPTGDCWKGFTLRNVSYLSRLGGFTQASQQYHLYFTYITSNTVDSGGNTTLTFMSERTSNANAIKFFPGDRWEIRKVEAVLDQPGYGKGDLLSNDTHAINTVTGRASWPHNVVDGNYQWANKIKPKPTDATWQDVTGISGYYSAQVDRVSFNAVRPGYPWNANTINTPANRVGADNDPGSFMVKGSGGYAYPHPLVSGVAGPTPTPTPTATPAATPKPPSGLRVVPPH